MIDLKLFRARVTCLQDAGKNAIDAFDAWRNDLPPVESWPDREKRLRLEHAKALKLSAPIRAAAAFVLELLPPEKLEGEIKNDL